jgi:hypothetical protein
MDYFAKDYKAKMFQRKGGLGGGRFADGLDIFSVSQGSHHGGNRRGGTSVYIRYCNRRWVMYCPLFYKSQKCGEGGKL